MSRTKNVWRVVQLATELANVEPFLAANLFNLAADQFRVLEPGIGFHDALNNLAAALRIVPIGGRCSVCEFGREPYNMSEPCRNSDDGKHRPI